MVCPPALRCALLMLVLLPAAASAQIVEGLGSRALGMGGAFVAVANDSSATWWNPGALADGPFLDATIGFATTEVDLRRPAARTSVTGFSLTTPPAGFSYYRWRLTEIPTAEGQPGREDEQGGIPLRSLSAAQLGVTLVHSLMNGVHAGATVKYVRGHAAHRSRQRHAAAVGSARPGGRPSDRRWPVAAGRRRRPGAVGGGRAGQGRRPRSEPRRDWLRGAGRCRGDAVAASGAPRRCIRRGFEGRAADGIARRRRRAATTRRTASVAWSRLAVSTGLSVGASRCAAVHDSTPSATKRGR